MAKPNSKIVLFKQGNPDHFSGKQQEMKDRIRAQCRNIFSEHLVKIHHEFFNRLDDELFSLSDKAENSSMQTVYFEAMRFVRRERKGIENRLLDVLLKQYDDFWNEGFEHVVEGTLPDYDEDSFSLIENEVLEEDLAVSTMIDKLNQLLHTELYGLDRRFAALCGKIEMDSELNPVGPHRLCHGFEQVIKPLLLDLQIKLLIYKFYEKHVSPGLNRAYREINSKLVDENVLPKLNRNFRQPEATSAVTRISEPANRFAESSPNSFEDEGLETNDGDSAPGFRAFEELHSLLDEWRFRNGLTSFSGTGNVGPQSMPVYPTGDVLNVLSGLQTLEVRAADRSVNDVKSALVNQLNLGSPGKDIRPLAAPEEDVIDMVGMLFDFILDDEHLPDKVKALIGRLQIPVIKVAILEKGFFSRKSHPVRELLNKMAKVASRLDGQSLANSALFAEMESIVESVLTRFDHNIEVFSEALERLNAFLEKDEQRTRIAEERTIQVTESKEQIELAKSKIGYALIRCIQGKELPMFLRAFLNDAWKHVLLLTYLRRDKSIGEWEGALGVVSRLIWTITPVDDLDEKRRILQELPNLEKDIRVGLENISFEAHKATSFFKQLEVCQMQALDESSEDAANDSCERNASSSDSGSYPSHPTSGRELAAEIEVLMERVFKVDQSLFNDLDQGAGRVSSADGSGEAHREESVCDNQVEDTFVELVRNIEVGRWMTFKDENNEPVKAKLSWKSPVTENYVFVNTKGAKIAEKSMYDLAEEIRDGFVTLVEDQNIPAVDRALNAMMESLENLNEESRKCV